MPDSLDRFPEPPVEADPVAHCLHCGAPLHESEEVVEMDGEYYCDSECLIEKLREDGVVQCVVLGGDGV